MNGVIVLASGADYFNVRVERGAVVTMTVPSAQLSRGILEAATWDTEAMTNGLWFGSLEDEEYRYNLARDQAATGDDKPVPTRRQLAYAYGPGLTTNPADHTWTLLTSHERKETLDGLSAICRAHGVMGPGS
ncbi:hypothetical protein NFJ02_19g34390 [Pycnococcus provasolii]